MPNPTIIAHGGAGAIHESLWPQYRIGARLASEEGQAILDMGGSALDAVIAAVMYMEDSSVFNAGTGSAINSQGMVECDAFVMTDNLLSGAVAAVTGIKNPVTLARVVMDDTPHKLIVGRGAEMLAAEFGIERVDPRMMITERRWTRYMQLIDKGAKFEQDINPENATDDPEWLVNDEPCDTVGALAIDKDGNLAAGGSTGGIMLKLPGRAGDTPVIGSGGYCGPAGAATCTGHGEVVMRLCLSKYAYDLMENGMDAKQAADASVRHLRERANGYAGIIVLDRHGNRAWATNTDQITVGIPGQTTDATSGFIPAGG